MKVGSRLALLSSLAHLDKIKINCPHFSLENLIPYIIMLIIITITIMILTIMIYTN